MKQPKSLTVLTGLFVGFLIGLCNHHIQHVYNPLKQSLSEGNLTFSILFGSQLLFIIIMAGGILKLVGNINKKRFFIKQNYICFYIIGVALQILGIASSFINRILDQPEGNISHIMCLIIGIFMFILAEIFRYGYHLKEEQDLTI